jgi:SAM-dependent methyltransferase
MPSAEVQSDWYRSVFSPEMDERPWADKTVSEVDRLITMLKPLGNERLLDLGCGTGRHSLELVRRGFSVVGVELMETNVNFAKEAAEALSLSVEFIQADLRDLDFRDEFDLVVTLNDGGVGYLESDAENLRTFEVISRALKDSGRHLGQTPNVLFAEKYLPETTWIQGSEAVELTDHVWNSKTRRMEGMSAAIRIGEVFEGLKPTPYSSRLYTVDELKEIYTSLGMTLTNTFRGSGKVGRPRDTQYEIFWEARKGMG